MNDQDQGFTIKDKRHFTAEGEPKPDDQEDQRATRQEPQPPRDDQPPAPEAPPRRTQEQAQGPKALPPVDFGGLILSLSHAALTHLGQAPDPAGGQTRLNLDLARHTIDTIAMLREKTKGNLDEDEQRLIDNALTQLRLVFVEVTSKSQ